MRTTKLPEERLAKLYVGAGNGRAAFNLHRTQNDGYASQMWMQTPKEVGIVIDHQGVCFD